MIVVDSRTWINLFRGRSSPQVAVLTKLLDDGANQLLIPDLVLFEVLRGFSNPQDFQAARRLLAPLGVVAVGGETRAHRASEHYRLLRRLGITIASPVNVLLASFCIDKDLPLLHCDADFDAMQSHCGLPVLRY